MTTLLSDLLAKRLSRRAFRFRNSKRFVLETLEARQVMATLIAGQVVHDLNGNGAVDVGEPGQAKVAVYIDYNENGQLDLEGTVIEPDDYADNTEIDASFHGISFSVVDDNGVSLPETVVAHFDDWDGKNYASTGDQVFARKDNLVTESFFWDEARLRIDFDPPVSSVQLDYTGTRQADNGLLQAFTADGTLIDGYQTNLLPEYVTETMEVVSGQANIAYVLAHDKRPSLNGRLDALRVNAVDAEPWTLTNSAGDYSLYVSDGATYRINQVVPDGAAQTLPSSGGGYDVVIDVGQTVSGINFANESTGTWQNPVNPLDVVSSDNYITPSDVLAIVNEINQPMYSDPMTGKLQPPPPGNHPYFDVDGNGSVTPTDVILVVNFINNLPPVEGEPSDLTNSAVAAVVNDSILVDGDKSCSLQSIAPSAADVTTPPLRIDAQTAESVFSETDPISSIAAAVMDDDAWGDGLAGV